MRQSGSFIALKLDKEDLAKDFELEMKIRTFDQDGLIFACTVGTFILADILVGTRRPAK